MKTRFALLLIFIGVLCWLIWGILRLQHWPLSTLFWILFTLTTPFGLAVLLYKTLRYPGFKDFLDS